MFLLVNNGKVLCSPAKKKNQMILLKKNIFHKYWSLFCGRSVMFTSINQSITQFIYVNMWDGFALIIHTRGSCMKRMTIN